ncbi:hypothetical protein [Nocardia sp. NPDC058705]|uniref:hypothetical protein n=1 Tax=Nocardia sp. NPDC058705 TaxID=3346609 RepID=UPI00369C3817
MVNKQNPVDQPTDPEEPTDLEEPIIEGPEPQTARDFFEDSRPGPGTAREEMSPSGPAVSGEGWTATVPE